MSSPTTGLHLGPLLHTPSGESSRKLPKTFNGYLRLRSLVCPTSTVGGNGFKRVRLHSTRSLSSKVSEYSQVSPTNDSLSDILRFKIAVKSDSHGVPVLVGLSWFLLLCVLSLDFHVWTFLGLPRAGSSFLLTLPFLLSSLLTAAAGALFIPVLRHLKAGQVLRKEGPKLHRPKAGTPTMGGLFLIPVALLVARMCAGRGSVEVWGVGMAAVGYWLVGLLDDGLVLVKKHNKGLPGRFKFLLQACVSVLFCMWCAHLQLSAPHQSPGLVALPRPLPWLRLHPFLRQLLSVWTLQSMVNAVNLTDGVDGLAAGTCAIAFLALSVCVLPVSPALAVTGASMAGACLGFLVHNRPTAGVFMGDTGSLALGGALAAMAVMTGMFCPLAVVSLVFIVETLSVILQVGFFKVTKRMYGEGRRLFLMSPIHHHLEMTGLSETAIIALAYAAAIVAGTAAVFIARASL